MATVTCPSCGNAVDVPAKKSGLPWLIGCLVALVVLPVIIGIVGLLAAIAVPSFIKARQTSQVNACINNMRMIDSAKEQAAMEQRSDGGAVLPNAQISPYLKGGLESTMCPAGGDYTVNPVGTEPECSIHGPLSAPTRQK